MADMGQVVMQQPVARDRSGPSDLHVVLTTEGTYPHFRGGVSTWCEALMRGMPETDFTVWALMMNPFISSQYVLPRNVKRFVGLPLWGTEEPVEYTSEVPAAKVIYLARRTRETQAKEGFVPLLKELLTEIGSADFDPGHFGQLLYQLHLYFRENDYRATFRSRATWDAVTEVFLRANTGEHNDTEEYETSDPYGEEVIEEEDNNPERGPSRAEARDLFRQLRRPEAAQPPQNGSNGEHLPSLNDATEGLRWLYRLLLPLNVPIPEADVVHSSAAGFCAIPGILAKVEKGTPFLLTEHGVYMREQYLSMARYGFPYYLKKFLVQMIAAVSRTAFYYADQISPVCEFNARWELRNGAERDRIRVIYNGVDPVSFSPRRVSRPSAPTVVSIARIDPLKDLETFLRVADLVRQHIPSVQFLHYGPVADREYDKTVKALHRDLNLGNTVKFMGTTDNPAEAYNQADVVLLTSISEAFPYSVVESLMCGKPVVSTDVGGVKEALEGVGLLARPKDIEGLADATLRLLNIDASARQELEAACRDRALNRFTIDAALEGYRRTYVTLAEAYRRERAAGRIPEPQPVLKPQLTVVAETPEVETVIPTVDERQDVIIVDQGLSAPPAEIREEIERQRMMPPEELEVVSDAGDIDYAPEGGAGILEPTSEVIEPEHDFEVRELQPVVGVSLNSDDPRERIAAFEEAYRRGGAELSHAVRTLLNDPDPEIRRRAIAPSVTAEALPRTESIHLLSQVLSSDPDPTVRSAAAAALATVLAREES